MGLYSHRHISSIHHTTPRFWCTILEGTKSFNTGSCRPAKSKFKEMKQFYTTFLDGRIAYSDYMLIVRIARVVRIVRNTLIIHQSFQSDWPCHTGKIMIRNSINCQSPFISSCSRRAFSQPRCDLPWPQVLFLRTRVVSPLRVYLEGKHLWKGSWYIQ